MKKLVLRLLFSIFLCVLFHIIIPAKELHVKEFGAIGDGVQDDGPVLRSVFEEASKSKKPTTIHFESNKTYVIKPYNYTNGRLMLIEASNVTIEGNNALLLVHTPNRALGIYRSQNILIQDLQIDYRPVPYVQGTITKIDNENSYLEFEPHAGFKPPVEGDGTLYVDGRNEDSVTINHINRKFYHAHSRISGVKKIDTNRFRITYRGNRFTEAVAGDYFAMKHRWGKRIPLRYSGKEDPSRLNELISTGDPSIGLVHSNQVSLINIRSYSAPGMTLNARGCSDLVIRGLQIRRIDDRLIAGNSDGIHVKCNESQPLIQDCHIEATMDDSIHIKISGDQVTEVASPQKVKTRHMDIAWDNTNLGKNKQVLVYDHDLHRELAKATIIDYQPIDYRNAWVTFDREIPGIRIDDSLYLQVTNEAVIERCTFGTQLQRAILTHQPTAIRDCIIEDNGQGIVVDFAGIEGPPSQRIRVERCAFRRLKYKAISIRCPSKEYDQRGDPPFICTNSIFDLFNNAIAFHIVNSNGVSLENNKFLYTGQKPPVDKYILFENSPVRANENNRFIEKKSDQ